MTKRKKIFFIATAEYAVNAFLIGHIKQLSNYFDISLIFNSNNSSLFKDKSIGINLIPMKIERNINILSDILSLFRLIIIFIKNRPDVVHSITPKAGLLSSISSFCVFIPIRIHTFTGQVWANKKGLSKIFLKFFDFLIAKLTTFNIIDSPSQRDFLICENVINAKKSIVFGNGSVSGVDVDLFKSNKKIREIVRKKLSISKDSFVFIYLGRLSQDKGILDLSSAFGKFNNKNIFLIFVGPDEENLKNKIIDLSGKNKDQLRFIPYTVKPYNFLTASDVICLPSYREGFGSVIIEAAAVGIPSIASNIYGLTDAVLNNKTGILFPPKNINNLYKCMKAFSSNKKLVKEYGKAAKKRAQRDFNSKLLSKYWVDFYLENLK
jgi:glycosyltransferase involved in cell wall biosynthesis